MGVNGIIENTSELAELPAYCSGTLLTRSVSHDPKSIEEYQAIYGESYLHLHHYCWALNGENHLGKMTGTQKISAFSVILNNIGYILAKAPPTFSLLPDIYITKARVLFKANRDSEALDTLFQLTQLRPGYSPAYQQLGEYYQRIGKETEAIKFYELGLSNTSNQKNIDFFLWKIRKLNKEYIFQPHSAVQAASDEPATPAVAPTSNEPDNTVQMPPTTPEKKPNPYCRFCP